MSNIHVERFLMMVLFSCREAARPPPRCWMPQRFTFAKEFFQKMFCILFREACFTTKSDFFGQRPNGGGIGHFQSQKKLEASLESFNILSNRYFPGCYNGDDVNEARVGDGHADHWGTTSLKVKMIANISAFKKHLYRIYLVGAIQLMLILNWLLIYF